MTGPEDTQEPTEESKEIEPKTQTLGKGNSLLKIFSGAHMGGEFELNDAEYIIGSADSCDIIFQDQDIADQHAKLTIKNKNFLITSLEGQVYVNGEIVTSPNTPLSSYVMVTLGGTHFALGFSKDQWPNLPLPKINVQEKIDKVTEQASSTEQPASQQDEELKAVPPQEPNKTPTSKVHHIWQNFHQEIYEPNMAYMKELYKEKPILAYTISVICALFLFGLIFISFEFSNIGEPNIQEVEKTYLSKAQKIIDDQNLTSMVQANGPFNGFIELKGYVFTELQKANLLNAFDLEAIPVDFNVYVESTLIDSAATVLSAMGYDLTLSMDQPGVLKIEGVVSTLEPIIKAIDRLKGDVAGITRVENLVLATDGIGIELVQYANELNLNNQLNFELLGRQINIKGKLLKSYQETYAQFLQKVQNRVGDLFQVISKVEFYEVTRPSEAESVTKIKITIFEDLNKNLEGVFLGSQPYLVMNSGQKIYEKQSLPTGEKLIKIHRDHLVAAGSENVELKYEFWQHAKWVVESN